MNSKNILMAGLPASGKSTYITALWAVEKDGKSGHLLTCDGLPSESSYIDEMSESWMLFKAVRRTTYAEPVEISLQMKTYKDNQCITLSLPDFKGEIFQGILFNSVPDSIKEWSKRSNGIIYMLQLGNDSPEFFQEQVSHPNESISTLEKVAMNLNHISPVIQNVLLLKYLCVVMPNIPIAICFSSWDKIDNSAKLTIEEWVKRNHPCLFNFVKEHFSTCRFYGISAQGTDYENLNESQEDELAIKTTEKKRAFIYTDKVSYDITEPLNFLIQE